MSADADEWTDLRGLWQSQPQPGGDQAVRLQQEALRAHARMQAESWAERILTLACAALFLWWSTGAIGVSRLVFLGLAAVAVVSLAVTSHLRRQLWRAQANTVAAYRALLRRRAMFGLALARLGLVAMPAGLFAGFLIGQQVNTSRLADAPVITDALMLVITILLLTGCAWCWQQARRYRALLARLDAIEPDGLPPPPA